MILKTIQDYYDLIFELYPTLPKSDIKRILLYGFKSYYMHNNYGADVLIQRKKFSIYSGNLMKDSLKYFNYYKRKMCTKLRIMYKRYKIPWDGYYYFALTLNLYDDYLKLKNKRGRPRKVFSFDKVFLFKLFDECNISESNRVAIFRLPKICDSGFIYYKPILKTSEAELVLERPPLKFNDILSTNYRFSVDIGLKQNKQKEKLYGK